METLHVEVDVSCFSC